LQISLRGLILSVLDYFLSPISAGFLSMAVRNAPFDDYGPMKEILEESIEKEINAAGGLYHPKEFDYRCIFSPDERDRDIPLADNLDPAPDVASYFHQAFRDARQRISETLFIPRTSDKTIGRYAQEEGRYICEAMLECSVRFPRTLADVERVYHETGAVLRGPVEVRWAWKYNDLKPRVYYAQGPTCYHPSKYVQAMYNIFVDANSVTHRLDRFNDPLDRELDIRDRLFIYDYYTFTSLLHEVRNFIRETARFMTGTRMHILDTREGIVTIDAGEYLQTWNEACNIHGVFDVSRIFKGFPCPTCQRHNTGMLGVPGNISSCTLLHGIHLCFVLRNFKRGRTVGDDALGIYKFLDDMFKQSEWDTIMHQINNIGIVVPEKFETWDHGDEPDVSQWQYIKRPLNRGFEILERGLLMIWPSIANILALEDPMHTEPPLPFKARRRKAINQWMRLLTVLSYYPDQITDLDRDLLLQFQKCMWKELHLPKSSGLSVFLPDTQERLVIPRYLGFDEFGSDWVRMTIMDTERKADGKVRLPAYRTVNNDEVFGWAGEEAEMHASQILGLLEKLGYVERGGIVTEEVDIDELIRNVELGDLYATMSYTLTYKWTVVRDFPVWYEDVRQFRNPHVPHEYRSAVWKDMVECDWETYYV
jgi:hypothetical protein